MLKATSLQSNPSILFFSGDIAISCVHFCARTPPKRHASHVALRFGHGRRRRRRRRRERGRVENLATFQDDTDCHSSSRRYINRRYIIIIILLYFLGQLVVGGGLGQHHLPTTAALAPRQYHHNTITIPSQYHHAARTYSCPRTHMHIYGRARDHVSTSP